MDKIILAGMEFYGYHGILPQEQFLGQKFTVDVELSLELEQAGYSDTPEQAVDYASVFDMVRTIIEGRPRKLLESVAEAIAESVLKRFPAVKEILVRVKKPHAPLPGKFDWVAVEINRKNE
ncbi:MAG: dihydroneopterin aldolase [Desulfotomaculaceae bacterium]|nr:dihydroneopterin aldolase [Desulfotomaculaceae bacterium]